jgi:predicted dithiol-disulfide oxidoreductase (DUF899 family)
MQHAIASQEEWLAARKALLAREKEFTKARDALSAARRDLPWVKVDKDYAFDTLQGRKTLADLFGNKSQLVVYHFMLGPGWVQGCPSCSYLADHFDGMTTHLAQRDVTFMAVSRAPLAEIEAYKKRMGWHFPWASSFGTDFNRDLGVTFSKDEADAKAAAYNYGTVPVNSEELPGLSAFYKNERGEVFHTYSTYARGLDILVGTYNVLDMAPKGRDEDSLPWSMAWVRRHDEYENAPQPSCCG